MHFTEKLLYPAVICDVITSAVGVMAVFGVSFWPIESVVAYGIFELVIVFTAVSLSLFALSINYWTFTIWRSPSDPGIFILRVCWVVMITIDLATNFLGCVAFFASRGLLGERFGDLSTNLEKLEAIEVGFAVLLSVAILISPMLLNAIRRFSDNKSGNEFG